MGIILEVALDHRGSARVSFGRNAPSAGTSTRTGTTQRRSGIPLNTIHQTRRIFRQVGPERSEGTPGGDCARRRSPTASRAAIHAPGTFGAIPEAPTLAWLRSGGRRVHGHAQGSSDYGSPVIPAPLADGRTLGAGTPVSFGSPWETPRIFPLDARSRTPRDTIEWGRR